MPRAHDLPAVLKSLTERNALALTEAGWNDDVKRLEETIQRRRRWLRYVLSVLGVAALILILKVAPFASRPDDARIMRDVQTELSKDSQLGRFPIEVKSVRGIVRLVGTVTTEREADHAEDIARRVSGVKRVINELKSTR
jgi:osmotically-inducible protein OsmY